MAEEFLQEIKEAKHTDDPHDSASKESLDGYIEIDNFNNKNQKKEVKGMIYKDRKWVEVDEELPRNK
jgi:hypothetical protein